MPHGVLLRLFGTWGIDLVAVAANRPTCASLGPDCATQPTDAQARYKRWRTTGGSLAPHSNAACRPAVPRNQGRFESQVFGSRRLRRGVAAPHRTTEDSPREA